jgi:hypothetical protein
VRTGNSLAINAHAPEGALRGGHAVVEVIAGVGERRLQRQGLRPDAARPRRVPAPTAHNSGNGGNGSANSAGSHSLLANGVRGSTCGKLTMYFTANHKRSLTSSPGPAPGRPRPDRQLRRALDRPRADRRHPRAQERQAQARQDRPALA